MDVRVPDLGDFADVEVIDVLVKPGDAVAKEDPLITLETEKASMDVPSPASGKVRELKVEAGSTVSAGDVILVLEEEAGDGERGAAARDGNGDGERGAAARGGNGDGERGAAARGGNGNGDGNGDGDGDARPADDRTVRQPRPRPQAAQRQETMTVTVPDLGDFSDVEVIEVLVAVGDAVTAEQGLVTLETEKAAMDVPAPAAGVVKELRVAVGGTVSTGDEIAVLEVERRAADESEEAANEPEDAAPAPRRADSARSGAEDARAGAAGDEATRAAPAPRRKPAPAPARGGAPRRMPAVDEAAFSRAHASPSVRKLARELGVDLGAVRGSGRKGRVTAADVKSFVKEIMTAGPAPGAALPEVPKIDFAKFGPVKTQPLSRIQKIAGPRLHASWVNVPHVTQHDEADITSLEETREALKQKASERGVRLTPLAFFMRACVLALAEFPAFKASLSEDGRSLVMKQYMHLGFAVDTEHGLVVPVIRDADGMDVYEIAESLTDLSERARAGKLKPDDVQGGVFTISSLGGIGGSFFTPIINAPEVAILGVSRSRWKPVLQGEQFVPRLLLPLSLSYDHRVIDGAVAARFIVRLGEILGDPDGLLEATP